MNEPARFCTACGAPLAPEARFCTACGRPVATVAAPVVNAAAPPPYAAPSPAININVAPTAAAAPSPYAEQRLGIIASATRKKGFMGIEAFNIVVTNQRLIFALVTNDMIQAEIKRKNEESKARGEGFFSRTMDAMTIGYTYHERYQQMTHASILAENAANFFLPLNQVQRVKTKSGQTYLDYDRQGRHNEKGKLELETSAGKYEFDLPPLNVSPARQLLAQAGLRLN